MIHRKILKAIDRLIRLEKAIEKTLEGLYVSRIEAEKWQAEIKEIKEELKDEDVNIETD